MDIVAQIEQLSQRRKTLQNEIASIDVQMERVRVALGMPVPKTAPPSREPKSYHMQAFPRQRGNTAVIRAAILDSLAQQEPQTVVTLAKAVGVTTAAVNAHCVALVRDGQITRQRSPDGPSNGGSGGHPYLYARSQIAPVNGNGATAPDVQQSDSETSSAEAADDLG